MLLFGDKIILYEAPEEEQPMEEHMIDVNEKPDDFELEISEEYEDGWTK